MIDEKTMVADTLAGINGELTRFGEIYQLARAHQYYVPAEKASTQEIQHVKNILTQG